MALPNPAVRFCAPFVKFVAIIGGYALLALSFLVAFEVVARKLFDFSLQGADEIGGYIVAIMVAFGFTYALIERAHTRIDLFHKRLPALARAVLNAIAMLMMSGMSAFMAWRAVTTLLESVEMRSVASTPLQTPLWLPQTFWVAGMIVFALMSAVLMIHALTVLTRDHERANHYYGTQSLEEEIEREKARIAGLDDRRTQDAPDAGPRQ